MGSKHHIGRLLSSLDIIVIFLVFALGVKGLLRGFVKEVAGLVALIGGLYVASHYYAPVGNFLAGIFSIESENTIKVGGFLFTLAVFWIGLTALAAFISKMIDMSGLGFLDKGLGFLMGGGKVFLILSVIVYAVSHVQFFAAKLATHTEKSITYPYLIAAGGFVMRLDPEDLNITAKSENIEVRQAEAAKEAVKSLKK